MEIYVLESEDHKWIFRFRSKRDDNSSNYYSTLSYNGTLGRNSWLLSSGFEIAIKPASYKQKQKLIKSEVKNGYFHELEKEKK